MQRERRHILSKDNFLGHGRIQKIGHGLVSVVENRVGFSACGERAAVVRIIVDKVARDGVDDALQNLCPGGTVEKNRQPPMAAHVQYGKLLAKYVEVDHDGAYMSKVSNNVCRMTMTDRDGMRIALKSL